MSTFQLVLRDGLGAGVDPHLDVRLGHGAPTRPDEDDDAQNIAGYLEFGDSAVPGSAFAYLMALVHAVYDRPLPHASHWTRLMHWMGVHGVPVSWKYIARLGLLTSDPSCGVMATLARFDPKASGDFDALVELLRQQRGHRTDRLLADAAQIGLTVTFRLAQIARALDPVVRPGRVRQAIEPSGRSQALGQFLLAGGRRPSPVPLPDWLVPAPPPRFSAHEIGATSFLSPALTRAARELRTGDPRRPPPSPMSEAQPLSYGLGTTGQGVVVGVVDFGCDFAHRSFLRPDGNSRIEALWDQNDEVGGAVPAAPSAFGYGRIFDRAAINAALQAVAVPGERRCVYKILGYDPHLNHYTLIAPQEKPHEEPFGAHGTAVLEVAVGSARQTPQVSGVFEPDDRPVVQGVAPDADIVFVQVRQHPKVGPQRALQANDVLDAVAFVFEQAGDRPCVVNLSLNTMSGPHDGDGYFERRLSQMLHGGPAGPLAEGRAVVVAAGNVADNWEQWQHVHDTVADTPFEFVWSMPVNDRTRNSLEIWYDARDAWLAVALTSPDGTVLGPVPPGRVATIMNASVACGDIVGSRLRPTLTGTPALALAAPGPGPASDDAPGRHVILIEIDPSTAATGDWTVTLTTVAPPDAAAPSGSAIEFHAWLERDDNGPSGLARAHGPRTPEEGDRDLGATLGTLSCGADPIVVGAYDATTSVVAPFAMSACGPGRYAEIHKPDLAAPGRNLWLIRSKLDRAPADQFAKFSGTSLAAPFVTGVVACLYADAWSQGRKLPLDDLKRALIGGTRPQTEGAPSAWTPEFGHGRLAPPSIWQALHVPPLQNRSQLSGRP